jgi:hypothetical protein
MSIVLKLRLSEYYEYYMYFEEGLLLASHSHATKVRAVAVRAGLRSALLRLLHLHHEGEQFAHAAATAAHASAHHHQRQELGGLHAFSGLLGSLHIL